MAELVVQFSQSGLSGAEFARRNGLTEGQRQRLSTLAARTLQPAAVTLQRATEISVRISDQVLGTAEKLAMKSLAALERFTQEWPEGEIPDRDTLKRIQMLTTLLTLPLRLRPKDHQPAQPQDDPGNDGI